jgi:hypothetical protein
MRSHHLVAARVESPGVGWSRAREIRRRGESPGRGEARNSAFASCPIPESAAKSDFGPLRGSLCVKDAFAKKFFGAGRDSAGGALASVLRKHSSEGRTPDAAERATQGPARS